jgi:hypothetical protein
MAKDDQGSYQQARADQGSERVIPFLDLTELANLAQKWNPISGRFEADAGRQALIEQLAQMTAVMARTNLGKAAEFARTLGNLCNC